MSILQSNSGTFSGTGNFTVSLPTAPASTSLVVVEIAGNNVVGTPSGWTLRTSQVNYMGHYLWDRQGDGTTTSWTFSIPSAGGENWSIHEVEGATFGNATSQNDSSTLANYSTPSITPSAGDVALFASIGSTSAEGVRTVSGWTNSFTEVFDTYATAADYPMRGLATRTVTASGAAYSTNATYSLESTGCSSIIAWYTTGTPGPPSISLRAAGTATAATAAVTAVAPAVPSGTTTGDLSVLTVWAKPYNTTIGTPSGWTKIGEATNGTVANGVDTGSTKIAMFVKESATAGSIGNLTLTSANSAGAVINTYAKDPAKSWDFGTFTTGTDTTNGANYSATAGSGLSVATGDWVLASTAVNGDIGTLSAITLGGMSGATVGTTNTRQNAAVTTGNDTRGVVVDGAITAGSSSAAPTMTYTNASSTSGTTMFLRLRHTSGAVPVSKAVSTTWKVVGRVTAARSTKWNVNTVITKAISTPWNVLASAISVSTALDTTWNALKQETASRSTSWNVQGLVAASRSTSWNALMGVSSATSTKWNTLVAVGQARSTLWNVASSIISVSKASSTTWNVRSLTTASRSTTWGVRAFTTGARSTTWNVLSTRVATRSTTWNARALTSAARSTTWNVRALTTAARSTSWNALATLAKATSTTWNVRAITTAARSTSWNVMGNLLQVSRALGTSWNTVGRLSASRSTTWNVRALTSKTLATQWTVRSLVAKATGTSWNVLRIVPGALGTSWNDMAQVTGTRSTSWTVNVLVGQAVSAYWHTAATVGDALDLSWNTLYGMVTPVVKAAKARLALNSIAKAGMAQASGASARLVRNSSAKADMTQASRANARIEANT